MKDEGRDSEQGTDGRNRGRRRASKYPGFHTESEEGLHTVDDAAALAAEQTEKVMPPDKETSEPFRQFIKR